MLLKMDERVSCAIDEMIAQRTGGGPEVFFGDTLDFDKLWLGGIYKVSGEFASLADQDALEIIPRLIEVFDQKKAEVMKMNLPETVRDSILFKISSWRRQIGIDARLREIMRGGISFGNDAW